MNTIKTTLVNAGFLVTNAQGGLIVSLNRQISIMEVDMALNYSRKVFYGRTDDNKVFFDFDWIKRG